MQLSRKIIEKWGGTEVFEEALRRAKSGAVMKAEVSGNIISGEFAHVPYPIKCSFTVKDDGTVESHCPCEANRRHGLVCVHVVALAISVMERLNDPVRQQKYIEEQRHAKRIQDAIEATFRRGPGGMPAQFFLELPGDFVEQFDKGAVTIRSVILQGGRPVFPEKIPRDATLSFNEDDDTLIDVLEDISEEGIKSTLTLNRIDFLGLLDVCRGRSLYVSGKEPVDVAPRAARFSARIRMDRQNGDLTIEPQLDTGASADEADGDGTPPAPPVFLAELERSFAFADGVLWPLKPTLPTPYHSLYRQPVSIPRAGVPAFIANELPALGAKMPIAFEEGLSADCFTVRPGKPKFHLSVSGTLDALSVRLEALYGAKRVVAVSPEAPGAVAEPDDDDFYNFHGRNIPAERLALSRVVAAGFRGDDGASLAPLQGRRLVLNFLGGAVPPLRRLGWTVDIEGALGNEFDRMDMMVPVVKVVTAGVDCRHFDVSISFEDSSRHKLPQPLVQQAINKGESFVDFDGHRVLIDRDAVESMRRVFGDCSASLSGTHGAFRMSNVYAPYVDSSLAALDGIDVELPKAWQDGARRGNRTTRLEPVALGGLEGVLRPYQKTGVFWMRFLESNGFCGILADEMGLGKTLQTLTWLSLPRCSASAAGKPALVVAPTSLVENWHREAEKFVPSMKCLVMQGASRHDNWEKIPEANLVVTSYALLRRDLDRYSGIEFSAAILDEAQHIKNRSTQNAIAAKKINAPCRLVLSGTPVENGVADVWSIMDFLMPGYLGDYERFRDGYEFPIAAGGADAEEAQARLHKKLRPFLLRRVKKDVAKDLPDKIQKVSFSELAEDQAKIYSALAEVFREKIDKLVAAKGLDKCRMDVLAVLLRLRQASCHLSLLPKELLGKADPSAPSGKLEQFLEILHEAIDGGHRMLVFSQFVGMLAILRRTLDSMGVKYCYLDGSTKDRLGECRTFNQDASIPVFLISLKAGGTGLNLTGADMVVHFDPWWNPAVEDQATDRAHRIGQKRVVTSIKLIAQNTVEEKVLELQRKKQAVIQATVGTDDSAFMQSLTMDDIRQLLA